MHLDTRQRAMLREMGVRVWQPVAPAADLPPTFKLATTPAFASGAKAESEPASGPAQAIAAAPGPEGRAAPFARPDAAPARPARLLPDAPVPAGGAPECWRLGPAQTLHAEAAQAGGARWLVLAQAPPAALDAPAFDGDAGRLLANMLRAARLHQGAGAVVFAPLVRQAISGPTDAFSAALSALIGQVRPDIVLIMGRLAGQALLASSEPFGKLRGRPQVLQGHAAVVTYDAPYLLRCPLDKARAWDDLCLAIGLAQRRA